MVLDCSTEQACQTLQAGIFTPALRAFSMYLNFLRGIIQPTTFLETLNRKLEIQTAGGTLEVTLVRCIRLAVQLLRL